MITAFKKMIDNWKDFSGRTGPADYWLATLAVTILYIVVGIVVAIPFVLWGTTDSNAGTVFAILGGLLAIVATVLFFFTAIAHLSMEIRRIRDAGFPWWFWFVWLLPVGFSQIIFIVFLCIPSSDEPRVDMGGNTSTAAPAAAPAAAVVDVAPDEVPVVEEETIVDKINNTAEAVEAKIDEAVDTVAEKVEDAVSSDWTCPACGMKNDGKFCSVCGAKKP